MINIRGNSGNTNKYVMEFVADTVDDIKDLRTDCTPGSVCIVISTADVYILNGDHKWKVLGG